MLCPNGVSKINSNMDKYLPNPSCVSPLSIQMFEFVGKLMGVSLRAKATLPFSFPSLVWKVDLVLSVFQPPLPISVYNIPACFNSEVYSF